MENLQPGLPVSLTVATYRMLPLRAIDKQIAFTEHTMSWIAVSWAPDRLSCAAVSHPASVDEK